MECIYHCGPLDSHSIYLLDTYIHFNDFKCHHSNTPMYPSLVTLVHDSGYYVCAQNRSNSTKCTKLVLH